MSDTRQIVSWALERSCPLRTGENWHLPEQTRQSLLRLQLCADRIRGAEVVDGIWVTSSYWGSDASGNRVDIPCSGIRIDDVAKEFGGWDVVRATCHNCEANVAAASPGCIAGCHQSLDVLHPYSEELESLLWETMRLHGLEGRLRSCFQVTRPLWFGFWIDSPLRREQCELLLELLPRALPRLWGKDESGESVEPVFDPGQFVFSDFDPSEHYGNEFHAFFRALKAAMDWELPLHVSTAPPGHADLGYYTQFAHCPRCKAEASVGRWTESIECREYRCEVCGHTFDPSATYRSERDDFDLEEDSLEKQLGNEYDAFAIRYGQTKGLTEQQMVEALDTHRDGPLRRRVAECRKRDSRLERRYAPEVLTANWDAIPSTLILEIASGVTLEMQRIMPGTFVMGSTVSEQEQPPHPVHISRPFYLAKYPVTQDQWEVVMGSNPSYCRGRPKLPVEQVNWFDAQEFCARLSEIVARHMRLPSEAEWEYACRAGTTTAYSCGDHVTEADANFDASIRSPMDFLLSADRDQTQRQTTPVDQFPPNPWGIFDMHGNVEEWCQDSWHATYKGAPDDGRAWVDENEPVEHVARGGAAYTAAEALRSAARGYHRANCGARTVTPKVDDDVAPNEEENELMSVLNSLVKERIEFYGLRIACSPGISDAR
jgi:formylglycine-generating enzyme required for sulfatase activity/Zn ribbon nucleic-acid-binding protein